MQIVTAGIIEKDDKILIAKRRDGKCLGPRWEFPGGKLEQGETPEECLKRELLEELNVETEIGEFVGSTKFSCDNKLIELQAYKVTYISGEIELNDHEEIQWISFDDFDKYEFVKADMAIINILISISDQNCC